MYRVPTLPSLSTLASSKSIESCVPQEASHDQGTQSCRHCPFLLWDAALSSAMTVVPKAIWSVASATSRCTHRPHQPGLGVVGPQSFQEQEEPRNEALSCHLPSPREAGLSVVLHLVGIAVCVTR